MFSLLILIGRTLFLIQMNLFLDCMKLYSDFKAGADGREVPPVPIPNTEVKLSYVENTWLVTAWEFR